MKVTPEINQQCQFIWQTFQLILEVESRKGNVNRLFIEQLESRKLPLLSIIAADNGLKQYATRELSCLNFAIEYAKTNDKSARKRMISEASACGRIAEKLVKEMY